MVESSLAGVQILRALALAVRSEQDFQLVPQSVATIGVLRREGAAPSDAIAIKHARGYKALLGSPGFEPLWLREALNKIAHADPTRGDYYVGPGYDQHDLLLYGSQRGRDWFAAVSLIELVKVVRALPDVAMQEAPCP